MDKPKYYRPEWTVDGDYKEECENIMNNHILTRVDKTFYKKCSPEETIRRIREILYDCGIYIMELNDTQNGFYHSHLHIANDNLLPFDIQTNGKGMTPAYSLASGYAEMMERLQNNLLFCNQKFATKKFLATLPEDSLFRQKVEAAGVALDYESFPDEKNIPIEEYLNSKDCLLPDFQKQYLIDHIDSLQGLELNCLPFYDVFGRRVNYIPQLFCSGSNGMCAGNSPAEAIVQGFCEIFERYALRKIMLDECIPPQIPLEYFEGTAIYDKIMALQNRKIVVLDCSFGMKLPVIGSLIIDTEHYKYRLMMAGATTATVALERCLTEHFQASQPEGAMHNIFSYKPFPNRTAWESRLINYLWSVNRGDGELDVVKLLTSSADFQFEGFHTVEGDSHEEELSYIFNHILKPNHFDCYIRDNSILGFPSYHIVVPGMSDVFRSYFDDDQYYDRYDALHHKNTLNFKNQTKEWMSRLAHTHVEALKNPKGWAPTIFGGFLYNQEIMENAPDYRLFLATIFMHCKEYADAHQQLQIFIESLNAEEDSEMLPYFNCCLLYTRLKSEAKSDIEISIALKSVFAPELVEEVLVDMGNDDQLQYYDMPSCFHCEDCPVTNGCRYLEAMKILKNVQKNNTLNKQTQLIDFIRQLQL